MTIAIIDYGMGNVRSLMNAFEYIGEDAVVTADFDELEAADRLVLPGVGAFGDAMKAIEAKPGLRPVLDRLALEVKKPVLGVCLGMQLFARVSHEHGTHQGLGWLDAEILPLDVAPPAKVPHVAGTLSRSRRTNGCSKACRRARATIISCTPSTWSATIRRT